LLSYRAYGLNISSEIAFPELPEADGPRDAVIRRGPVSDWSGDAVISYGQRFRAAGARAWIRDESIPFVASIENGGRIDVSAPEGVPAGEDVRLYLLGSCAGMLLYQRGLVVLHGNTIETPGGAALFCGHIGAGKSTLTMALLRRGYRLIADDVCGVSFQRTPAMAVPGFPRLKLWRQTLDMFGEPADSLPPIRTGTEKFHYPVANFCPEARPLRFVYVLNPAGSQVALDEVAGARRLAVLTEHLYKVRFRDAARNWPGLAQKVMRLADEVRVVTVSRPPQGNSVDELASRVEHDFKGLGAASPGS